MGTMKKNERVMTVSGLMNNRRKEVPFIRMQGQWLKEAGFEPGTKYKVETRKGKLVLTVVEE